MSMWTGDSYAFFNNLDYSAGPFNMARAPQDTEAMAAREPAKAADKDAHGPTFARRPSHGMATNPFRNDTGA